MPMRAEEIQKDLRKQPFQPLPIHLPDESHNDVRHPSWPWLLQQK
jgi:hypothetical protein